MRAKHDICFRTGKLCDGLSIQQPSLRTKIINIYIIMNTNNQSKMSVNMSVLGTDIFVRTICKLDLVSYVSPQYALEGSGYSALSSYETAQRSSTKDRNFRKSLTNFFSRLSQNSMVSTLDEGLFVLPILWITSFYIAYNRSLRLHFQNNYFGKLPCITAFILQSARTGQLNDTGDAVYDLKISGSTEDWVVNNGLSETILDVKWLEKEENFLKLIDFYSKISNSGYVPTIDRGKHFELNVGKTLTLSSLSIQDGRVFCHRGSSFPEVSSSECAILGLFSNIKLVKPDSSEYLFTDSHPSLSTNMNVNSYASVIFTFINSFETSDSGAARSASSTPTGRKKPKIAYSTVRAQKVMDNSKERGPKPPEAGSFIRLPQNLTIDQHFLDLLQTLLRRQ